MPYYDDRRQHPPNYAENEADCRVILLFDMDSFEVQVHQATWMARDEPPRVVANADGRLTSYSYEAKRLGINRKRTQYFEQAERIYTDLVRISIPQRRNSDRPNTLIALKESSLISKTIKHYLHRFYPSAVFEFASHDEFYVEITNAVDNFSEDRRAVLKQLERHWPNTFIYNEFLYGFEEAEMIEERLSRLSRQNWRQMSHLEWQEIRLMWGSTIANEIVHEIRDVTGYQSSVGIASNKLMAKIASVHHKPGSITVVAPSGFWKFTETVDLSKIPTLGGKIGNAINSEFSKNNTRISKIQAMGFGKLVSLLRDTSSNEESLEKAHHIKDAAFGFSEKYVVPIDYCKTSSVERTLVGKGDLERGLYSYSELHSILSEECDFMIEKLQFELDENERSPIEIKLRVKLAGQDSILAGFEVGRNANLTQMKSLFSATVPRQIASFTAKSIKIAAKFQ